MDSSKLTATQMVLVKFSESWNKTNRHACGKGILKEAPGLAAWEERREGGWRAIRTNFMPARQRTNLVQRQKKNGSPFAWVPAVGADGLPIHSPPPPRR